MSSGSFEGPDQLSNPAAFQGSPQQTAIMHAYSDKDSTPEAQHHSLGSGPTQAAPGNHTHTTLPTLTILSVPQVVSLPVASASIRGQLLLVKGNGTTTADTIHVCILQANGTYAWKTVTLT